MQIGKWDVMVLVVMGLSVVSMSFVMPALGLADTSTQESDIPTLTVDSNRFSVATDRPRFPNTATEGTLVLNTTKDPAFSDNQIYLKETSTEDVTLALTQNSSTGDAVVTLSIFNDTSTQTERVFLSANNTSGVIVLQEYEIAIEATADHNPPDYLAVSWKLAEQETTDSWVGRIPGVGALFDTADLVAQVLAWAVTVFIWFSTSLVFGALNLVGILIDASVYFLSLLAWLITTYASVVSNAPSWTSVFVALPGIILSVTLAKVLIILFRSLPTT
jgi:hypothetical protein